MAARASVRHKVLDSASELFYMKGYNATGIQQIVDNAGVAKTSLYEHFTSKEELCIAYLSAQREEWINELVNYCSSAGNYIDWTYKAFEFLSISVKKENFRGCSFLNILGEVPMDSKKILKEVSMTKSQLRALFQNRLTDSPVEDLSDAVYVLFEGAMIEIQVQKDTWPIEASKLILSKLLNQNTI